MILKAIPAASVGLAGKEELFESLRASHGVNGLY